MSPTVPCPVLAALSRAGTTEPGCPRRRQTARCGEVAGWPTAHGRPRPRGRAAQRRTRSMPRPAMRPPTRRPPCRAGRHPRCWTRALIGPGELGLVRVRPTTILVNVARGAIATLNDEHRPGERPGAAEQPSRRLLKTGANASLVGRLLSEARRCGCAAPIHMRP